MSVSFDWATLSPFIAEKLYTIIQSIPSTVNPMLTSTIKVKKINLGDSPPIVAVSKISSIHLDHQCISLMFKYKGNAEFELGLGVNANALGASMAGISALKNMGMVFAEVPLDLRCRFLLSSFDISVQVEVTHGPMSFIRFEAPPKIELLVDSNIGKLGPAFDSALRRIQKIARESFDKLPRTIEIPLPNDPLF